MSYMSPKFVLVEGECGFVAPPDTPAVASRWQPGGGVPCGGCMACGRWFAVSPVGVVVGRRVGTCGVGGSCSVSASAWKSWKGSAVLKNLLTSARAAVMSKRVGSLVSPFSKASCHRDLLWQCTQSCLQSSVLCVKHRTGAGCCVVDGGGGGGGGGCGGVSPVIVGGGCAGASIWMVLMRLKSWMVWRRCC